MDEGQSTPSEMERKYQYSTFFKQLREYREGETKELSKLIDSVETIFDYEKYKTAKPRRNTIRLRIVHDKGE